MAGNTPYDGWNLAPWSYSLGTRENPSMDFVNKNWALSALGGAKGGADAAAAGGYQIGTRNIGNGVDAQALFDPQGNVLGQQTYDSHSSLRGEDYAKAAAVAAAYFGGQYFLGPGEAAAAAGAAGDAATAAAWGSGAGLGGDTLAAMGLADTAALGGGQVAALGGSTGVAGLGGSAGGGLTAPASSLYAPSGYAAGGNALAGPASSASSGLFGLSGNTWANLGQMGVGLYAQDKATDALSSANNKELALQREMWQQNRADNQPLLDLRNGTLPQINALMKDPSSITQDPGYQFGLNQGQSQIDNSAAARGGYYSGAQMKASQRYGQDYAGTKLDQSLNRLMGVAGLGQVGGTNNQQNNNQFSQQQGNALMNGGNIRGSGYMGMANTIGNGLAGIYNDNQQQWWNNQRNPFGGP